MTARPQPMAGESEVSDDLIAELAKLMASDAGETRATPTPKPEAAEPPRPSFSVRIPGGETPPTAPVASSAPKPTVAPKAAPASTASAPKAAGEAEPFNFDFDFPPRKDAGATSPVPQQSAAAPAKPAPSAPNPAPAATAAPAPEDHDSIADLIAAEFAEDLGVEPAQPAPTPPVAPTPVKSAPEQAPRATNFTQVDLSGSRSDQQNQDRAALTPVNLQPTASAETDRFKVPPVFGLGSSSAPQQASGPGATTPIVAPEPKRMSDSGRAEPQFATPAVPPRGDVDPIDEIESLIGRAVQVDFDDARNVQPAPEQDVAQPEPHNPPVAARTVSAKPVATTAAPKAAAPRDDVSGLDEAILAAAEATGAHVGWVDAADDVDAAPAETIRAERSPRALGMTRALAGPLVAVTLLLAAGFGLYWVLGLGGESGPAPLLTAETGPVKEVPPVEPDAAAQQSVVFNEIDGVVPGAEEQLVSRDQADVNEVTQVAIPDVSEEGLANRKVRTVTVRPDGTIVSGEDSVAGSAILPVERPDVPEVPGAETASPELLNDPVAVASVEPAAAAPAEPSEPTVVPVVPGTTVSVVDLAGNPVAGKSAPVPMQRSASLVQSSAPTTNFAPTSPVNAVVDTPAPAAPLATPAPLTQATEVTAVGNNAPAYVQLASQRTEEDARQSAARMITRFGPLFGGANMEVQRVDLGARGIYYRVRVPANSLQEANTICTNVKAAGGDCFTM